MHLAFQESVLVTFQLADVAEGDTMVLLDDTCDLSVGCLAWVEAQAEGKLTLQYEAEEGRDLHLLIISESGDGLYDLSVGCCSLDCGNRECGLDGCGNPCGSGCQIWENCSELGFCESRDACGSGGQLSCSSSVNGFTGNDQLFSTYSCGYWDESGSERGYLFIPEESGTLVARVYPEQEGSDLDLVVLVDECSPDACVAMDDDEVILEVSPEHQYLLIVDGYEGASGEFELSLECQGECLPDCTGKVCGEDGCGGSCGYCAGGCVNGACYTGPGCVVDKDTKGCQDCACEECVCAQEPNCCDYFWSMDCVRRCINSCGGCPDLSACGDQICAGDENCDNCYEDCGCNGSVCHLGQCCVPDCLGRTCGDDSCGGTCGQCGEGFSCSEIGSCQVADCWLKPVLGCGQSLDVPLNSSHLNTYNCSAAFWPGAETLWRLDIPAELSATITATSGDDLGLMLLEAGCDPESLCTLEVNESGQGDPEELWLPAGAPPFLTLVVDSKAGESGAFFGLSMECCLPECEGLECGSDGCWGSCGQCVEGYHCSKGVCVEQECVPDCQGMSCGDDGCEGSCGECGSGEECFQGSCVTSLCVPNCEFAECGPDGCGGFCGQCRVDAACRSGLCVPLVCEPACDGRVCGGDGCGGSCGLCDEDEMCVSGRCEQAVCLSYCKGQECGPDPICGTLCGTCTGGLVCLRGRCTNSVELDVITMEPSPDLESATPASDGCTATGAETRGIGGLLLCGLMILGLIRLRRPDGNRFGGRSARTTGTAEGLLAAALVCIVVLTSCFERRVDRDGQLCKPGLNEACYTGQEESAGVGECRAGTVLCWEEFGEVFQECRWQVLPAMELCDGLDNDCDGYVDDDGACALRGLDGLRAALGPVQIFPSDGSRVPEFVTGTNWLPLFSCQDKPRFECADQIIEIAGPVLGLVQPSEELEAFQEVTLPGVDGSLPIHLLGFQQVWNGVEVEGGALAVWFVGDDVYSLSSTVQPVRRNNRIQPQSPEASIRENFDPEMDLMALRLVLTRRPMFAPPVFGFQAEKNEGASGGEDVQGNRGDSGSADAVPDTVPIMPAASLDQRLVYRVDYLKSGWDSRRAYFDAVSGQPVGELGRNMPFASRRYFDHAEGGVEVDPAGSSDPWLAELEARVQVLLDRVDRFRVKLNAAALTTSLLDTRFPGQVHNLRVSFGVSRTDLMKQPELFGIDGVPGCGQLGVRGWQPLGSDQVFLCAEETSFPPVGVVEHELSHLLFQYLWDPELTGGEGVDVYHDMVRLHAALTACATLGEGDACALESVQTDQEVGSTVLLAAVEDTLELWGGGPEAADEALDLVYSYLWTFLPTPTALSRDSVSFGLTNMCMLRAYAGISGPDKEDCQNLLSRFAAHGLIAPCAVRAEREICNHVDDDCDGLIDECDEGSCLVPDDTFSSYTMRRWLYSGPEETRDVGRCRARQEVCGEQGWTLERPERLPAVCPEGELACNLCNGADDDCDWEIDELCPCEPGVFTDRSCGPPGGEDGCRPGVERCSESDGNDLGGVVICFAGLDLPGQNPELCDGWDNDCDGAVDEAPVVGTGRECAAMALGNCSIGISTCISGELVCLPGQPMDEGCSTQDLDCDGMVRESWVDRDGDGYFGEPEPGLVCPNLSWDCSDNDPLVHPAAMSPCGHSPDNNCDGEEDEPNVTCICIPSCEGRSCGDDGCGGSCGSCQIGAHCEAGSCKCDNSCDDLGWSCGFDSCGMSCGTCGLGQVCHNGECCDRAAHCNLRCGGFSDGCGGVCGANCPPQWVCDSGSHCVCMPDCTGKACGPDPVCGTSCGVCPSDKSCSSSGSCI